MGCSVADVKVAQGLQFDPGTIVVDDRGYNDYDLFGKLTSQGVLFVTLMKGNALYEAVGRRDVPQYRNILKDELIEFVSPKAGRNGPILSEALKFMPNNHHSHRLMLRRKRGQAAFE